MNKKMSKTSVFLYGSAVVMAGIGSAALYSQISNFNALVAQYVEQGYEKADVMAQLVPNQLMPAVYNTVSVNLGFTLALIGLGLVAHKLSASKTDTTVTLVAPAVESAVNPVEEAVSIETEDVSEEEITEEIK